MAESILLLGVDPGIASFGWALVRLLSDREVVETMGVVRTEKSDTKRKVLVADDNVRRTRDIAEFLHRITMPGQSRLPSMGLPAAEIKAICAESMSHPRNSSAAAKMALTWGVVIDQAVLLNVPIVQASPQEIKKAVCGTKEASKEDVQAAMRARYGTDPGLACLSNVPKGMLEHPFDALAAVVAGLNSDVIRMARGLVS